MPTQAQRDFTKAVVAKLVRVLCSKCRAGEEITYDSEGSACHGIDPSNGCGLESCVAEPVRSAIEDQGMYHLKEGQALDDFIKSLTVEVTDGPGRDWEALHCRNALNGAHATIMGMSDRSLDQTERERLVEVATTINQVRDWIDEAAEELHQALRNSSKERPA